MNTKSPALPSDLKPRAVSGIVLILIAAAAVYLGGSYFIVFTALLTVGVIWECFDLICLGGTVRRAIVASLAGTAILSQMPDLPNDGYSLSVALTLMVGCLLLVTGPLFARGILAAIGGLTVVTLILLGCLLIAIAELRGDIVIAMLIPAVVGTDIGAYFTGRLLRGPKLAPSISPNKTWSGALGGVAMAVVLGSVAIVSLDGELDVRLVSLLAVFSICSQIGDLAESWLKRRAGIKDSGTMIPGHGGFLDRFDGFLGASVLVLGPWFLAVELGAIGP